MGLSLVDGFGVTRGTVVWYRVIRHSWANLLEQISISKISSRSLLCEIVSIELLGSNLCQLGDSGVQDGAYLVIAEFINTLITKYHYYCWTCWAVVVRERFQIVIPSSL